MFFGTNKSNNSSVDCNLCCKQSVFPCYYRVCSPSTSDRWPSDCLCSDHIKRGKGRVQKQSIHMVLGFWSCCWMSKARTAQVSACQAVQVMSILQMVFLAKFCANKLTRLDTQSNWEVFLQPSHLRLRRMSKHMYIKGSSPVARSGTGGFEVNLQLIQDCILWKQQVAQIHWDGSFRIAALKALLTKPYNIYNTSWMCPLFQLLNPIIPTSILL